MSEKLPRVTANEIIKIVEGKRVTIAYHSGKILHPKVVKSILVDAGLSVDEFKKMMKK